MPYFKLQKHNRELFAPIPKCETAINVFKPGENVFPNDAGNIGRAYAAISSTAKQPSFGSFAIFQRLFSPEHF
jgi:hypothetical protein